jgi:adenosylcobinamide-GDP ribazoletransferase
MIRRFLGALQFLTVLPVSRAAATPGESAVFFPVVGVLLGALAGGFFLIVQSAIGRSIAALLSLALLMAITGCLHEDGLADAADAFRAGRSPEKILLILKDSRIGAYGAVALILTSLIRWQGLVNCRINPLYALLAALALSRTAMVALAGAAPPVGEGLGRAFAAGCTRRVVSVCIALSVAISFIAGAARASALVVADAVALLIARSYFIRRIGGVNGDCLGAICVGIETLNMVILACQFSI